MEQQSEKRVAVRAPAELTPSRLTLQDVKDTVEVIKLAEELVMNVLEPGIDWGIHPGTTSYALKDPGAAKIINAFRCYSDPEIIRHVADDKEITFVIKGRLIHRNTGETVGTGVGSCSSLETKYRYRWVSADELGRQGLKTEGLKTRGKGENTRYRITNPEWDELQNTIFKMACKRYEVDAAQGLPGVGTALGKLFGKPVERTYRWFWPLTQRLGFPNEEAVHKVLGVSSMKDWLAKERTLDEAIEVLISTPTGPTEKPAPIQEVGSLPAPPEQRTVGWRIVKTLLQETKPQEAPVTKWFKEHFNTDVVLADFDADQPPDKLTDQMLSRFHDSLLSFKEEQKRTKEKQSQKV